MEEVWWRKVKHVYVMIREDGAVKVGIAASPNKRVGLVRFETKQPVQISYVTTRRTNARAVEVLAHKMLKEQHHAGEWFWTSVENAIDAVNASIEVAEGRAPDTTTGIRFSPNRKAFKTAPERISLMAETCLLGEIDEWRRVQQDIPCRAEAVRRLIMKALLANV